MPSILPDWERKFEKKIQDKELSEREIAGALLSVIPSHAEWDCFLSNVKSEWENWNKEIERFPNNLVVLYSGLAFLNMNPIRFGPTL